MPFHRANERQRNTGATAGVFDDSAAGLQPAVRFGSFDHGQRHAIFHAAGRILALELQQNARAAQCYERRMADAVEDRRGHACTLAPRTSMRSMTGGLLSKSSARDINA